MSTKSKQKQPTPPVNLLATTIMQCVSGLTNDDILSSLIKKHKLTQDEASDILKEARDRITTAAVVSTKEEIALTIEQLRDLYKRAIKSENLKLALDTLKEKSSLLGLYDSSDLELVNETTASQQEEAIREHLEPLLLALGLITEGQDVDVVELVRLIASHVINSK